MTQIAPNTRWLYKGPGSGKNEVHNVIFVEPHEITTVSFVPCRKAETGVTVSHAWNGPIPEFLKVFKPISQS